MCETAGTDQVLLHPNQYRGCGRDRIPSVEINSGSNRAESQRSVSGDHDLVVVRRNRRCQRANGETALSGNISAKSDRLLVRFDYLVVARSTARKTLCNESVDLFQRETDEIGHGADSHHVCGARVTGRLSEFIGVDAEVLSTSGQLKLAGVVNRYAILGEIVLVIVIRVLVKRNEYIHVVPGAQHRSI